MKVCFLILHYNEIKLTDRAVQSILAMNGSNEDKPIVIVDNCSPNGSGEELLKMYSDKKNIKVILNKENGGFAKGNNIGYKYIRENLDVDFVVALNNDISFPQKDFMEILYRVYNGESEERRFYLAGPDVWTPNIRSHISPLDAKYKDEADVKKRFDLISQNIETYRCHFDFKTYTRFIQDKYQGKAILNLYNKLRKGEYDGATPHDEVSYDCVLNGACLIFDRRYVEEYDYLFAEETFLYAEEDFLTYRLIKDEKPIRYCPELKVDHVGQGSSGFGGMAYRRYCEKNIQTQERCRESFEKYLKYIISNRM